VRLPHAAYRRGNSLFCGLSRLRMLAMESELRADEVASPPDGSSAWSAPSLECDIVMKGGITSGVVYPGAVASLARRYTFRSIGGASAGAIAAAAVAAAEYGRMSSGGFARLARVPAELSATDRAGNPFLLQLFRPDDATRGLFASGIAFLRFGIARGILQLLRSFWRGPAAAVALVALALALALASLVPWWVAVVMIAIAPWLLVALLGRDLIRALTKMTANDFGLCRLGPAPPGDPPPLTEWLHGVIQEAAGRPLERPLTFADLWGLPPLTGKETQEQLEQRRTRLKHLSWASGERALDLQVMTTNLTNGRPMRLPIGRDRYRDTAEDGGGLLFDPDEWARFFPAAVVEHMVAQSPPMDPRFSADLAGVAPGRTLHLFPGGGELPVVVAARMSLSFPVLISTIPLCRLRYRGAGQKPRLMRVVFSDGGISSNFPVHFFDAPLPSRPTFALNLGGFAKDEQPSPDVPAENVVDPPAPNEQAPESWTEIDSMFAFAVAIKDAMENWRDNTQGRLPGFRERIIDIKLGRGEGGLNLAMDEQKIERLTGRGEYAGERLKAIFSGTGERPEPTKHWNDSRFTRFRVTMSVIEQALRAIGRGYNAPADAVTVPYPERIDAGGVAPYALTPPELLAFAEETIRAYNDLVAAWGDTTLSDRNVPHPTAVLRLTPPV
jgi:predicted acylesterase/phospholipase RssA